MEKTMYYHRNSQKRIYLPGAVYFCTATTLCRCRYFDDPLLREIVAAEIEKCRLYHEFHLSGYAIMPDHIHIMFQPGTGENVSGIMHFIKRHSSRNINIVRGYKKPLIAGHESAIEGEVGQPRLQWREWDTYIMECRDLYLKKHGPGHEKIPFQWQKSYHDHYIRDETDFDRHMRYIQYQQQHHCARGTVFINDVAPVEDDVAPVEGDVAPVEGDVGQRRLQQGRYLSVTINDGDLCFRERTPVEDMAEGK